MTNFNGLNMSLGNLSLLSNARTRSISPENFTGEKGKGGMATEGTGAKPAADLGQTWKISPSIHLQPASITTLADITGPGAIQHIWLTVHYRHWRSLVLRVYWDNEVAPSIEVPLGDFFCNAWLEPCQVNSLPISVNPQGGFNSYWEMPFRKRARITIENLTDEEIRGLYYQITYTETDVPDNAAYFHAQWRRSNPLPYKTDHIMVDGIVGKGHYVGTYIAWGVNNNGWWGEGELKFFMDGDIDFPTICGTGTEDYFGGAWGFETEGGEYGVFTTPYLGMPQVIKPDGKMKSQQRFGLYRWHVMDPIRFETDFKVQVQAIGWRANGKYLPLQDDIASTVFWYQTEPHATFPQLPDRDYISIM